MNGVESVCADSNIYVAGSYYGSIDVDPGPGQSILNSNGYSSYIARLAPSGALLSSAPLTVNSTSNSSAGFFLVQIERNGKGDLIVCGWLQGTIDMDPGPGQSIFSVGTPTNNWWAGQGAVFGSYDSLLHFNWAYVLEPSGIWGGGWWGHGSVFRTTRYGDIYSAGAFSDTLDADPTQGTHLLIGPNSANNYNASIFVIKLSVCQPSNQPQLSVSASSETICIGNSTQLSATGASLYQWNAGLPPQAVVNITPTASGIYEVVGTDLSGCTNTVATFISVLTCTDLRDEHLIASIFPNPASDFITINFPDCSCITIVDATGKDVLEKRIVDGESIDISGLNAGCYAVRIQAGRSVCTKKFVKETP